MTDTPGAPAKPTEPHEFTNIDGRMDCARCGYSRSAKWHTEPQDGVAEAKKLVEDAFFLRQYGERPPGADPRRPETETWHDWERRAEVWLRSTPEEGGSRG